MYEKLKNLKIKIIKNSIYLMICILIIILVSWKIDLKKFFNFDNILENISYANNIIKKEKNIKIPMNTDLDDSANVIVNSTGFDEKFESKLKNYAANIYTINWNFDKALQNINNDDWKYYFNIWNIKLFEWYDITKQNLEKFNKNKWINAYKVFTESIENYNISAQTLWTWSKHSNTIINNRNIAYKFKFIAGVQVCVEIFTSYIQNFDDLQKKAQDISLLFDKETTEIENFIKTTKDQELIKCLKNLRTSILQSQISINNINEKLKNYKNSSLKIVDELLTEPDQCMEKIDKDWVKIEDAINQISWSLVSFAQTHQQFYEFIKQKDINNLKMLCQEASNQSQQQQQNQNNKNIQNGISKLDDVFNQNQAWQKSQDQQWSWNDNQQQEDQQSKWNSNQPNHMEITPWYEKEITDRIKQNSQQWIEQMNKLRWDRDYNVDEYIKQLFKDFWGNKKDFENSIWTWNKFDNNR